mmetsp:Transcript_33633/g.115677  ORF Transcript_33633/g.115677 Transcript_33633/m.115677 type:complete len:370 (+) Transcript_33633:1165-2274(+)
MLSVTQSIPVHGFECCGPGILTSFWGAWSSSVVGRLDCRRIGVCRLSFLAPRVSVKVHAALLRRVEDAARVRSVPRSTRPAPARHEPGEGDVVERRGAGLARQQLVTVREEFILSRRVDPARDGTPSHRLRLHVEGEHSGPKGLGAAEELLRRAVGVGVGGDEDADLPAELVRKSLGELHSVVEIPFEVVEGHTLVELLAEVDADVAGLFEGLLDPALRFLPRPQQVALQDAVREPGVGGEDAVRLAGDGGGERAVGEDAEDRRRIFVPRPVRGVPELCKFLDLVRVRDVLARLAVQGPVDAVGLPGPLVAARARKVLWQTPVDAFGRREEVVDSGRVAVCVGASSIGMFGLVAFLFIFVARPVDQQRP